MAEFRALAVRGERKLARRPPLVPRHVPHTGERPNASQIFGFVRFSLGFQYLLPLPRVQIWGYELKGFAVQSGIDRLGCLGSLMFPALITIALLFMFGMLRF
jgi:hypothetical protein